MEIETPATDEDQELTPEQEAEILGEDYTQPDTPADESADKETPQDTAKPDETVLKQEESETETPTTQFTQDQVETMIQDRLTRHQRELQTTNQQLQERLEALEKSRKQEVEPGSIELQDLGKVLNDPKWNGWTLTELKNQGHDEHYHLALGRIGALEESRRWKAEQETLQQQQAQEAAFQSDLNALKEIEPTYFNPDGKPNDTFKGLFEWAEKNQVFNLSLAHKMKNFDTMLEKAKKDAVAAYIEQASKGSLQRGSEHEDTVRTKDIGSMDDKALSEAYINSRSPDQENAIEKEMERRGLL